ncbi:hypothetical protein GCM10023189_59360 [Nibrella saemangeumensis]|uniref:Signal transduction histidine kinase n=1 Tax=Nibrella saemangeumensis TaxID=1084526 RepID=A0ABP8NQ37_9BACT
MLNITYSRKANPVAPYVYYLEDLTHALTYEQVSRFPLDSFKSINRQKAIQLGIRLGTVWLRFHIENRTGTELFLYSSVWRYKRMDVHVLDENGNLTVTHGDSKMPFGNRVATIAQSFVSIGKRPRTVHLALTVAPQDFFNDYLQVTTLGEAMRYQKETTFWQGGLAGVYVLTFLLALVFFLRLRDPLVGWYALFVYVNAHWFLDRSGYMLEIFGQDTFYTRFRTVYPLHLIFAASWTIFLIKLTQVGKYSKVLYYLIISWLCVDILDYLVSVFVGITGQYYGQYLTPLRRVLHWIGIEYVGYIAINNCFLLISVIYVSVKDFKRVRWYALAFCIGLTSMIIGILSLFEIVWLPYYPFNNAYFVGSLVEIFILGLVLAERTSKERQQQTITQQQLITQLQENLQQRDKLLRIRDEIARDLHDEVGATLTSIAISTKLVQKKVNGQQPDIQPILAQIKADSEETIHTIRDTVWALNPDNDAPGRLLERLRTVAVTMLTNQGILLNVDCDVVSDALPPFSMEQRRNIYLTVKEALHNIIKHAQATGVSLQIGLADRQLEITISDNGRGFDPAAHTEGNGLLNFQKRAGDGNFSVQVTSVKDVGTAVAIRVPVPAFDAVVNHPSPAL